MVAIVTWIVSIDSEQKSNLNKMRMCLRTIIIVNTKIPVACNKTIKFDQERISMKIPFFMSADTELLQEKLHICENVHIVPTKSFTSKINKHTACGYSLLKHHLFGSKMSKHDFYSHKDIVNIICANLKEHAAEIINCEEKKNSMRNLMKTKVIKSFVVTAITYENI